MTDDCAGQVLAALERLGLDHNTIVVYTSDHGEMLGDLGLWNKFEFYEGSCGVPLIFRVPGVSAAQYSEPVSLISLLPTLAELCGVQVRSTIDGRSIANSLRHPGMNATLGPVFAEYDLGVETAKYMIRDGDFKYTLWVHDIDELYDLRNDHEERHNLAGDPAYREIEARLRQQLLAWHRPAEL